MSAAPVPDLIGYELTIGQALADAIQWRRERGEGAGEHVGLYLSAARGLLIPGDVALGPGKWHPLAGEGQ